MDCFAVRSATSVADIVLVVLDPPGRHRAPLARRPARWVSASRGSYRADQPSLPLRKLRTGCVQSRRGFLGSLAAHYAHTHDQPAYAFAVLVREPPHAANIPTRAPAAPGLSHGSSAHARRSRPPARILAMQPVVRGFDKQLQSVELPYSSTRRFRPAGQRLASRRLSRSPSTPERMAVLPHLRQ